MSNSYFDYTCSGSLKKLAMLWAPINYQHVSLGENNYRTKMDLICPVNFGCYGKNPVMHTHSDMCWNTKKITTRLGEAEFEDLVPMCYYATAETLTHYFLLYAFYHADDSTHLNDLEGCLVILEKNESKKPKLFGLITIAHLDFWSYSTDPKKTKIVLHSPEQHDFEIKFEEEDKADNVLIMQSKGKHALYSLGRNVGGMELIDMRWHEIIGRPIDVVVYYPGENANLHTKKRLEQGIGTPHNPTFFYELVDIHDKENGLYNKWDINNDNNTFTKKGAFNNESGNLGGNANGPWLWSPNEVWFGKLTDDDSKYGPKEKLTTLIWRNPALLVKKIFGLSDSFENRYLKRMYDLVPN